VLRSHSLLAWAGVVAVGIAVLVSVAVIDHELKVRRMNDASVAAWYCAHRASRCGEDKPEAIEARWQQRERGYKIAIGVLLFAGGVAVVAKRRQTR
jgi:hypothetical protein